MSQKKHLWCQKTKTKQKINKQTKKHFSYDKTKRWTKANITLYHFNPVLPWNGPEWTTKNWFINTLPAVSFKLTCRVTDLPSKSNSDLSLWALGPKASESLTNAPGMSRQRTAFGETGSEVILSLPEGPSLANAVRGAWGHGQELIWGACEPQDQKQLDHRRMRTIPHSSGRHLSNWVADDSMGPPKDRGPMPCKRRPVERADTAKNSPRGAVMLRTKSSWNIDGCAQYVAAADGIWSSWVANDSMGTSRGPRGPMPCKCRPREHVGTAKNWPVRNWTKSGWIIDGCAWYFAPARGIWTWFYGSPRSPQGPCLTNAVPGIVRAPPRITCEACEP